MYYLFLLFIALSSQLFSQTIHSSVSTYYETKNFTNSIQKQDAIVYGVGADIHYNHSAYKLIYEKGDTATKQPPLQEDLQTEKLFLKYVYKFNDSFEINFNYINILNDNIAITDGGQTYGAGLTYHKEGLVANFTQFYTDYEDFDTYQSDLKIDYKTKVKGVKVKLTSIIKYIDIDEENKNGFTANAQDSYLTAGFKFHLHHSGYHFGSALYLGKRTFAIMDDGSKIQHHAMEFDRTYAIGVGKNISDFVVRLQYIYARATELAKKQSDVEVSTTRLVANYKF